MTALNDHEDLFNNDLTPEKSAPQSQDDGIGTTGTGSTNFVEPYPISIVKE